MSDTGNTVDAAAAAAIAAAAPSPAPISPPAPGSGGTGAAAPSWLDKWAPPTDPDRDLKIGYAQSKGWNKGADEIIVEVIQQARNLEGMRGVPADEIARIPKDDSNPELWKTVDRMRSVPDTPDKYQIEAAMPEGLFTTPEEQREAVAQVQKWAALGKMRPADAFAFAKDVWAATAEEMRAQQSEAAARQEEAQARLKASWGSQFDQHLALADRGAERVAEKIGPELGNRTRDAMKALHEAGFGDWGAAVMRHFGIVSGEDRLVQTGAPNSQAPMSREEAAVALKDMRTIGSEWAQRLLRNDPEAERRQRALINIVNGYE